MSCRVRLRIVPNAKRSEVVGRHGEAIKIKVAAPALEGRANEALIEFLASTLGLPRRGVQLVTGEKSRDKIIEVATLDQATAESRLLAE